MQKYFGTDGIRGKANQFPMTAEVALRLGMATGYYFAHSTTHRPHVIIAKDIFGPFISAVTPIELYHRKIWKVKFRFEQSGAQIDEEENKHRYANKRLRRQFAHRKFDVIRRREMVNAPWIA